MRRSIAMLAPIAIGSLLLSACATSPDGGSGGETAEYLEGGTFTMALGSELGGFDPYANRGLLGLSSLAYDSLINVMPDGSIVTGLAKEWIVEPTSATFTLNEGITCSDGTPLLASQIAEDLTYLNNPENSSPQYGVNVPTVPFTATGDDEAGIVTVDLSAPFGLLLETLGRAPIVCAAGMADRESLATTSSGTGPFVLSEVNGTSFTFTVREDYTWGPNGATTSEIGTPAKIVLQVIPQEATGANLLLSGELNFAKVTGPDKARLEAGNYAHSDWQVGGSWLSFNQINNRVTTDFNVRQALLAGLDFDQVVKVSTGDSGSRATSLVSMEPKVCPATSIVDLLPSFDQDAAAALLDDAGWKADSNGKRSKDGEALTIALHYLDFSSPLERPTAELVASMWGELGIEVSLNSMDINGYIDSMYTTSNWDVLMSGWDFAIPSQMVPYLSGALPPSGNNILGVDSEEYNSNVEKATALTPPEACQYWDAAEAAIVNDAYLAPISNRIVPWYMSKAEVEIQRYEAPLPTSIRLLK